MERKRRNGAGQDRTIREENQAGSVNHRRVWSRREEKEMKRQERKRKWAARKAGYFKAVCVCEGHGLVKL